MTIAVSLELILAISNNPLPPQLTGLNNHAYVGSHTKKHIHRLGSGANLSRGHLLHGPVILLPLISSSVNLILTLTGWLLQFPPSNWHPKETHQFWKLGQKIEEECFLDASYWPELGHVPVPDPSLGKKWELAMHHSGPERVSAFLKAYGLGGTEMAKEVC